jgi:hypothetical protein
MIFVCDSLPKDDFTELSILLEGSVKKWEFSETLKEQGSNPI